MLRPVPPPTSTTSPRASAMRRRRRSPSPARSYTPMRGSYSAAWSGWEVGTTTGTLGQRLVEDVAVVEDPGPGRSDVGDGATVDQLPERRLASPCPLLDAVAAPL